VSQGQHNKVKREIYSDDGDFLPSKGENSLARALGVRGGLRAKQGGDGAAGMGRRAVLNGRKMLERFKGDEGITATLHRRLAKTEQNKKPREKFEVESPF